MGDWFASQDIFTQVYWIIAVVSSIIFLLTLLLSLFGGDVGGDMDVDMDGEVHVDANMDFQFITFKNLIGFFTMFGWSGIACIEAGLSRPLTILVSVICGLIMMVIMSAMFYYMNRLNDSGTLDYNNAPGTIGEVYIPVGANRSKMGKVQIRIQGSIRELEALTDEDTDLETGTVIEVSEVTPNGILLIKKLNK